MAVPRFVKVENAGRAALINIESVLSIEADRSCGVTITTTNGRAWYMRIDEKSEDEYGGKIYAALHEIVDAWHHTNGCDDYGPLESPYRDQVVATLIEGEPIPVVVENPGEFRD